MHWKKWSATAALSLAITSAHVSNISLLPPRIPFVQQLSDVEVTAFYDEEFEALYPEPRSRIESIINEHNKQWSKIRPERFILKDVSPRDSSDDKSDGNYHLNKMIKELESAEGSINAYFMGQETFFYEGGYPEQYGGLAHNSGNNMIVFAGKNKDWTPEKVAVVFTHEAGHLYGARDLPLSATNSTYAIRRKEEGFEKFSIDNGSKHIITEFEPSLAVQRHSLQFKTNLEKHVASYFANAADISHLIQEFITHSNIQSNDEYLLALDELRGKGIELQAGAFNSWLKTYERHARPPIDWGDMRAVSREYALADAALNRGDASEALYRNLNAAYMYKGKDERVLRVIDAMNMAITEKVLATAASTSLRSK